MGLVEPMTTCHHVEESGNLLGEASLAAHPVPEARVVQLATAQRLQSVKHLLATQRPMRREPVVEEIAEAVG